MNHKIELLRQGLITTINQSGLSLGITYYVIKDLFKELEKVYFQQVEKQFKQLKEKQNQNQQENTIE